VNISSYNAEKSRDICVATNFDDDDYRDDFYHDDGDIPCGFFGESMG
jgi:hypothetical protein